MLLQLKDNELYDWGLIIASKDIDTNKVAELWKEYWDSESEDMGSDEFSSILSIHFPDVEFTPMYTEEIYL